MLIITHLMVALQFLVLSSPVYNFKVSLHDAKQGFVLYISNSGEGSEDYEA